MFAGSNTCALITLLVACLSDEQIDDQLRHAQRTGALVLLVCFDAGQLDEVVPDVAAKLPNHHQVSSERAALG